MNTRNKHNARRKTPPEEEAGVSTRAAKKRNTTIVTGKGTEKAKKKSATKEHGDDEYSPENVVIAATENNNPSPLLNTMKLDEGDNYADNNNKDGPIISSVLPALYYQMHLRLLSIQLLVLSRWEDAFIPPPMKRGQTHVPLRLLILLMVLCRCRGVVS